MKSLIIVLSCASLAVCQQVPIYQITVVERTVKAINYKYRSEPTMIDFRGTVLLPKAKGEALVQSKQGRTEIDASLENLGTPQKFGLEYMTYVMWALTPDGRPHNIGEVVPGTRDKAKLKVTTELQAFALIVTAEPYSAVRQPSDVVVAENVVRPDTVGKIEEVEARYELLPRGLYSYHVPNQLETAVSSAPKVSMREYEALSELYQAENAIGIARNAGAERYAPNTFAKAQQLLNQAQQLEAGKKDPGRVVEDAREAAEAAEDARVIAVKHQQDEKIARAQADAEKAQQAIAQAESAARIARADAEAAQARAEAAQAQVDAERGARQRAEEEAAAARQRAAQAEAAVRMQAAQAAPTVRRQQPSQDDAGKTALRMKLLEQLNGALPARDAARGLTATVSDSGFAGTLLKPGTSAQLARIAAILAAHPELRIEIDGHTADPDTAGLSQKRAEAVREALVSHGVPFNSVTVRGLGNSSPLGSNRTAAGREENQRVELVLSGAAIGNIPYWEQSYTLTLR
ncbi:MAG TPA: OmpA family protein [Bryobacteraceae bacterium]|nr:OmpA family protein [Bryobacteraceae bacterium]